MESENKIIYRRDTTPVIWYIPLDLTTKKVYLTVKDSLDTSDDTRIMDKANAFGGGSDSTILVEYENSTGKITWYPSEVDTRSLYGTKYYDITYTDTDDTNFKYAIPTSALIVKENIRQIDDGSAPASSYAGVYFSNHPLVGTKNGVNLVFTVGFRIDITNEHVYHGQASLVRGTHYSIESSPTDTTITIILGDFQVAPESGDLLTIDCWGT